MANLTSVTSFFNVLNHNSVKNQKLFTYSWLINCIPYYYNMIMWKVEYLINIKKIS